MKNPFQKCIVCIIFYQKKLYILKKEIIVKLLKIFLKIICKNSVFLINSIFKIKKKKEGDGKLFMNHFNKIGIMILYG